MTVQEVLSQFLHENYVHGLWMYSGGLHTGHMNSSVFQQAMEKHKTFELPQLRSITAAELGCDASGYSKAGNDTNTWYCVVVAGRPGSELTQMRGVSFFLFHFCIMGAFEMA
jgi:hypothetical protein